MPELLRLLAVLLGGGLAGALLTELFRRRRGRLQHIPLIERVNRVVEYELPGVTLARRVGSSSGSTQLEELKNLREYQLTLRNTSNIHLQDAEIQFEFSTEDSQAWTSRPALSKTALQSLDAIPTDPWKKAFRWRIPYLPSGDSVEFTFQAVDPPFTVYEVALYKADRVIIEKVIGEPASESASRSNRFFKALYGALSVILGTIAIMTLFPSEPSSHRLVKEVTAGGCNIRITSTFEKPPQVGVLGDPPPPPSTVHTLFNFGSQDCIVQSAELGLKEPVTILPGQFIERDKTVEAAMKARVELATGISNTTMKKTLIQVYEPK